MWALKKRTLEWLPIAQHNCIPLWRRLDEPSICVAALAAQQRPPHYYEMRGRRILFNWKRHNNEWMAKRCSSRRRKERRAHHECRRCTIDKDLNVFFSFLSLSFFFFSCRLYLVPLDLVAVAPCRRAFICGWRVRRVEQGKLIFIIERIRLISRWKILLS